MWRTADGHGPQRARTCRHLVTGIWSSSPDVEHHPHHNDGDFFMAAPQVIPLSGTVRPQSRSRGNFGGFFMGYDPSDLARQMDRLEDKVDDNLNKENSTMGDIAGLLALMQGNKGMDLPGLLALCKDKGHDRGWGGEGMFMFVFLLLFLFSRGGWGNLNGAEQAAFGNCAGNSCQSIIGLHDRISAAQAVSTNGFQSLQTWLCESIANVTNSIRNQGDRAVDATRNVGDTVRDCCCKMEAALATLNCKVDGVSRDIRESSGLINAKIELEALKAENARLARENEALKDTLRGDRIADAAVSRLERFAINHYTPTRTASSGGATA